MPERVYRVSGSTNGALGWCKLCNAGVVLFFGMVFHESINFLAWFHARRVCVCACVCMCVCMCVCGILGYVQVHRILKRWYVHKI